MKNIHLIKTDKPTGIFETNRGLHFSIMDKVRYGKFNGFHIYITSDEEIKPNEWYLFKGKTLFLSDNKFDEGNNPNNSNPRVTDLNKNLITILLFIDFRKAFDLVDSRKLILKFLHYGFDNSTIILKTEIKL